MKIQVNRDVLAEAVSFAVKLLPTRSTLPILGGVLIEASTDGLVLSSFDFEVSTTSRLAATVEEPGRVLVLGRLLADIASRLPNAPVNISTEQNKVVVRCGTAEFTLLSMSIDEYPTIPQVSGETGLVKADAFAEAASQVSQAASREDVLKVISGVLLEVDGKSLNLAATDRYRVAIRGLEWDSNSDEGFSALVSAKTISEIGKTFAGAGTISISLTEVDNRKTIAFTAANKTVTSLLIAGAFPPVQKLFPAEAPKYAVVNTAELVEATRRIKLVLERQGFLRCTFGNNKVVLESVTGEQAQAHETIDAVTNNDEIEMQLNADYLLDGLGAVHSEFTRISFVGGENSLKPGPVLLTSQTSKETPGSDSFRYLLQPKPLMR